jgi:hypothetical protein
MKVALSSIVNSQQAIQHLLAEHLPVKLSYRLSKLVRKFAPEIEEFNKARDALLKEYGEQVEKGWQIKPENMEKFVTELNGILVEEVELECQMLSLDDLASITPPPTGKDIQALEFLISEE